MAKLNIKNSIKQDYGFDLPISGGYGLSQDDPIIIETEDPLHAPNIQWRIIHCINLSFQRAWLISDKKIFNEGGRLLERVTTNVNYYDDGKPVRTVLDFYFDISSVIFTSIPTYTYFPTLYVDRKSQVAIPFQMGWLNFLDFVDNEKEIPGNGLTISYSCPTIKATFYIYNNQLSSIEPKKHYDLIVSEFEESSGQIDGEEITSKFLNDIESEDFLTRAYKIGDEESFIIFTTYNNHFFKFRITKSNDPFASEMAQYAIEQYIVYMRLYKNQKPIN